MQVQATVGQQGKMITLGSGADAVAQKCAELAQKRADYTRRNDQQDVEAAMDKLGCGGARR